MGQTRKVPRARHDTVILKRQEYKGSGIILPDDMGGTMTKEASELANRMPFVVFDVGPGMHGENGTWIPTVAKVGEVVCFRGQADPRGIGGEAYWFTRDCHIMAVVEEESEPALIEPKNGEREVTFRASIEGESVAPTDQSEN